MMPFQNYPQRIYDFIKACNKFDVKMILVGGGAVNFHGYQRHSVDVDFWIDLSPDNIENLINALQDLGYSIKELPDQVKTGNQNISIKISPLIEIELITNFNPGKSFHEAYADSEIVHRDGIIYYILSFQDLISSKINTGRAKDRLDVEELHRIRLQKGKS
jgi:hypothetical protein